MARPTPEERDLGLGAVGTPRNGRGVETMEAMMTKHPKHRKNSRDNRTSKRAPTAAAGRKSRRDAASPNPVVAVRHGTKLAILVDLVSRRDGATIADLTKATGWQSHSVRGAISGTLKKKLGLAVSSEKADGRGRVYRIAKRG